MDQTNLAPAGSFCWNPDCPDYAQRGHHNIRKYGRTDKGVQRYQCKTCKKTSAETKGTVFHGSPHRFLNMGGEANLRPASSLGQRHYLQVVKERSGSRLVAVQRQVVYGDPHEGKALLGKHTASVERTNLTSHQMNGRLVRKSLSYSKQRRCLRATCSWEDWVYNVTRPVKTLRQARTPAMAAGLTDHIWTVQELLMTVVIPTALNMN